MGDKTSTDLPDGVQLKVLTASHTDDLATNEKINTILDLVKSQRVVVLENGLSPDEESKLVERTMTQIQPDEFSGVEIESGGDPAQKKSGLLSGFLGGGSSDDQNIMVVAPAHIVEDVTNENGDLISTFVRQ